MANLSSNTVLDACQALAGLADTAPVAGGTLTINGHALGNYGFSKFTGSQVVSAFSSASFFTATADSESAFVIVNGDLTINSGQVFQPASRKLFTVVYVTGNLIVNGQIAMTARGANHGVSGSNIAASDILIASGTFSGVANPKVPAAGGVGVGGVTASSGSTGGSAPAGGTGGGGGGGGSISSPNGTGGSSAAGTSFSGGPAGGSASGTTAGSATPNGGKGGDSATTGNQVGTSAGNPAGSSGANSGTGGTLIIIVLGTYSGSGSVSSNGVAGQNTTAANNAAAAGSGSGGGSVTVMCKTNSGPAPTAAGGAAGTCVVFGGAVNGGAGGAGSTRVLILTFAILSYRMRHYLRR